MVTSLKYITPILNISPQNLDQVLYLAVCQQILAALDQKLFNTLKCTMKYIRGNEMQVPGTEKFGFVCGLLTSVTTQPITDR